MQSFFVVFSFITGLGLLTYGILRLATKLDSFGEDSEHAGMKNMMDFIQGANPGTKFLYIFAFGGMMLTEIVVKLINLPFETKSKAK